MKIEMVCIHVSMDGDCFRVAFQATADSTCTFSVKVKKDSNKFVPGETYILRIGE